MDSTCTARFILECAKGLRIASWSKPIDEPVIGQGTGSIPTNKGARFRVDGLIMCTDRYVYAIANIATELFPDQICTLFATLSVNR